MRRMRNVNRGKSSACGGLDRCGPGVIGLTLQAVLLPFPTQIAHSR